MSYSNTLKADKKLAAIITGDLYTLTLYQNIPFRLITAIMSQQLNTKVARVFHERFLKLCGTANPTSKRVLGITYEQLRSIGLSHAKATYVHNVAHFCVAQKITDKKLLAMSNEEVLMLLTQIKGVGRWTVEMLLMFSLGREDVFPVDDLGIQQAMVKLYSIKTGDKKMIRQKMLTISKQWSPFRTYACLHLWAWKDAN